MSTSPLQRIVIFKGKNFHYYSITCKDIDAEIERKLFFDPRALSTIIYREISEETRAML